MKSRDESRRKKAPHLDADEPRFPGSHVYDNWKGFEEGRPRRAIFETRLYTDAHVVGEVVGLGPCSFFNTLASGASRNRSRGTPAVVLRMDWHPSDPRSGFTGTRDDFAHYHGGDHFDELAALASLVLGRRFQAGPVDREFLPGKSPLGDPHYLDRKKIPTILSDDVEPQIPRLSLSLGLQELHRLKTLPTLNAASSTALVKSARLYQQAIWTCDVDPAYSWLLLVSAVETVADLWLLSKESPVARFKDAHGELAQSIAEKAPELLEPVAATFAKFTGAGRKFREFLLTFCPGPPLERPALPFQLNYGVDSLTQAFKTIYDHRSKALHGGTAFPLPMCMPPQQWQSSGGDNSVCEEVHPAMAVKSLGATWSAKSAPMLLHTFEHLTRGSLLNWWSSLSLS